MNLLSAENISKSYNERPLIVNQTLGLSKGDKVALVGANGAGKTTLLRILAGETEPDGGIVSVRKGTRQVYLPQQPELDPQMSIRELLDGDDNPVASLLRRYELVAADPDVDPDLIQELLDQLEMVDAWNYDNTQAQVLGKLGIADMEAKLGSLSGGQRKRVAMARMLLHMPDLMLLDEPTNHLDLDAIEWLENRLGGPQVTLLMVTHDRYFLDNVATVILELERGTIYRYDGNYAYFLEKKAEREAIKQVETERARNLMSKELEWMRRQPRARGTKAKYRIEAFYELKEKAADGPKREDLQLNVATSRQGGKVIEIHNASKAWGDRVMLTNFTHVFRKGERLGVAGRNGAGKSTFLNMLTGRTSPDSGQFIKGDTTKIGYYTQEVDNLNPENRVIDEVKEIAEFITLGSGESVSVSRLLTMFLFPPAQQYDFIGKLSGGEKRRLQLLKILVAAPNFLVLDEPTNDLDIDTLNVLEDFLESFPGCLVLVSHDRYFMDRLTDHLFIFEGDGKVTMFNGNYSDFRESRKADSEAAPKAKFALADKPAPVPVVGEKKKPSQKVLRELEQVEADIETVEADKAALVTEMGNTQNFDALKKLTDKMNAIDAKLDKLMARWEELQELV
ncbi:MAG: ABC-F family ATP-binding cassette domain-containing protein [Bacteroidota bacterium]